MEQAQLWGLMALAFFIIGVICITVMADVSFWFIPVGMLCLVVVIVSAIFRADAIKADLDEGGRIYIGRDQKSLPHVPPRRFYRCPDHLIKHD